jgi:hypothetical protein
MEEGSFIGNYSAVLEVIIYKDGLEEGGGGFTDL